jgi:hypothetical protein
VRNWKKLLGVLGGLLFAGTGAFWGVMNAGRFALERDAGRYLLQAWLGVGVAFVVIGFLAAGWGGHLTSAGIAGRAATWLLAAAPILEIVGELVEFAFIGTFALGLGLILLTVAVFRHQLVPRFDRWLILLSAVGSVTWNTETQSVWLLVGVGLIWVVLSARLIPANTQPASA